MSNIIIRCVTNNLFQTLFEKGHLGLSDVVHTSDPTAVIVTYPGG